MRTEGEDNGEWIIVDCGAAVVHVMQPAIRTYYHLEEIWGDKPVKMKLDDKPASLVKAAPQERHTHRRSRRRPGSRRDEGAGEEGSAGEEGGAGRKAAASKAPAKKTLPAGHREGRRDAHRRREAAGRARHRRGRSPRRRPPRAR
jgi:ribosome-associated protein